MVLMNTKLFCTVSQTMSKVGVTNRRVDRDGLAPYHCGLWGPVQHTLWPLTVMHHFCGCYWILCKERGVVLRKHFYWMPGTFANCQLLSPLYVAHRRCPCHHHQWTRLCVTTYCRIMAQVSLWAAFCMCVLVERGWRGVGVIMSMCMYTYVELYAWEELVVVVAWLWNVMFRILWHYCDLDAWLWTCVGYAPDSVFVCNYYNVPWSCLPSKQKNRLFFEGSNIHVICNIPPVW